jgi:muramoyltetrapeptide carboxypeptidase LdcA involved in peptidoglycan recycling
MKIGIFTASTPIRSKENHYDFLISCGVEVYEHPSCRYDKDGYLAGTVDDRVRAIHDLFLDKTVDVVMSFWGGLNSNQLLKKIDYELIQKNYKPIIGYSDTTALLLAIQKMTGKTTYLGPAGITFLKPEPVKYSYEYFRRLVINRETRVEIIDAPEYADDAYFLRSEPDNLYRHVVKNPGRSIYREGIAEGRIVAGNLQTFFMLVGTTFFPNIKKSILFLEEDESISREYLHRYLTHLSQLPDFPYIRGIVFGRLCEQSRITDEQLCKIFDDVFEGMNIPIIYNMNFGHSDPMFTIPIGGNAKLDTYINSVILSY